MNTPCDPAELARAERRLGAIQIILEREGMDGEDRLELIRATIASSIVAGLIHENEGLKRRDG